MSEADQANIVPQVMEELNVTIDLRVAVVS